MKRYRITRLCCTSGLCIYCHKRGNHGDRAKRARIVHADNVSIDMARRYLEGWKAYDAKMEEASNDVA